MKQEKVSFRQLMALLWAGLLGPAAEWLPSMVTERAGPAGWLVPLLALPVLLAAGWLAGSLSRGAGGLSQGLMDSFGPGAGRAVLTIYIIWMELLLALRLRLSAQRMMAAGERDGALWFFLPVLVLMALWISWGKAGRLARTGELFFLLLAAAAAAVVGLALFQVKGENLLPLWTEPAAQTLYAALPVSGVLGYGLYAAFLYTPEEGGERGRALGPVVCGGLSGPVRDPAGHPGGIRPRTHGGAGKPVFSNGQERRGGGGVPAGGEPGGRRVELQRLDPAGGAAPGHEADRGGPPPQGEPPRSRRDAAGLRRGSGAGGFP